jgi:hypothetical protein
MGSLIQRNKVVSKRKGMLTAAAATGSAVLFVASAPVLGVLGLAATAYFGYDWFMFRAKNGMRF